MKTILKNSQDIIRQHVLMLATNRGIEIVDVNTIVRIEALSNYSKIFFSNNKTLVIAKVLRWFEERLPAEHFIRIHRTHIVNKNFVYQYLKGEKSKILLTTGDSFDVSRRKKSSVVVRLLSVNCPF